MKILHLTDDNSRPLEIKSYDLAMRVSSDLSMDRISVSRPEPLISLDLSETSLVVDTADVANLSNFCTVFYGSPIFLTRRFLIDAIDERNILIPRFSKASCGYLYKVESFAALWEPCEDLPKTCNSYASSRSHAIFTEELNNATGVTARQLIEQEVDTQNKSVLLYAPDIGENFIDIAQAIDKNSSIYVYSDYIKSDCHLGQKREYAKFKNFLWKAKGVTSNDIIEIQTL